MTEQGVHLPNISVVLRWPFDEPDTQTAISNFAPGKESIIPCYRNKQEDSDNADSVPAPGESAPEMKMWE